MTEAKQPQTRTESDSMGEIQVRSDRYWGAQTQRSLYYFSIGSNYIPPEVIKAFAILKKACAQTNHELGKLPEDETKLITQAAEDILAGKLDGNFPLRVWMTGSGTQC